MKATVKRDQFRRSPSTKQVYMVIEVNERNPIHSQVVLQNRNGIQIHRSISEVEDWVKVEDWPNL